MSCMTFTFSACLEALNSICSCYDLIKLFVRAMWLNLAEEKSFPHYERKMKTFVIIVDKSIEICCMRETVSSSSFRVFPELSKLSETSSWKAMRITLYCSVWNSRWVTLSFPLYPTRYRNWLQTYTESKGSRKTTTLAAKLSLNEYSRFNHRLFIKGFRVNGSTTLCMLRMQKALLYL